MIDLLLGWLRAIFRIGILDFLSKIGWKAVLGVALTLAVLIAVVFLLVGLLAGLII